MNTTRIHILAVLILLAGCATTQPLKPTARATTAPPAGPQPAFHAPQAHKTVLDNGLSVIYVEKRGLPLVHTRIVVRSGSAHDPAELPGLAGYMAAMLKAGTTTRNAKQIAGEIEARGAGLSVGVADDAITVSFTSLPQNVTGILDVVSDVVLNPAFVSDDAAVQARIAEEIERTRKRRLTSLAQVKADPQRVASRVFRQAVYGTHPYGHTVLGNEATIKNITIENLRSYYGKHFVPSNAAVIIVGDIDRQAAQTAITERFSTWEGTAQTAALVPLTETASSGKLVVVDKAGAPQSQLRIGHRGLARNHPDYFSLTMCNAILGGLFNSRINMNLREDKGYTYGARSAFSFKRQGGAFTVYTGVRSDVTTPSIQEVLKEVKAIRDTGVTDEELVNAKNRYTLSLPGSFQTVDAIAGSFETIFIHELPLDYYAHVADKLRAVSRNDVQRVANAHIQLDDLVVVVVGDHASIKQGLSSLGRGGIEQWDADGNPI